MDDILRDDDVRGGPFYGSLEGCCTLCTRAEGCVAWSATSDGAVALVNGDRYDTTALNGNVRNCTPVCL